MNVPHAKYIVTMIGDDDVGKTSLAKDIFNINYKEDEFKQ